tara:strand:+ start:1777 stop:3666 length:1890 start_codon:yes stop_codon:yes gene_type:complete
LETDNNLIRKWILPKPINHVELDNCTINYTLQKILCRRGLNLEEGLVEFLTPSNLPNPEDHFKELNQATNRIIDACSRNEKIAICGDYDADGITSTVLLVELLTKLGGNPISYIPSRKSDGYGLNIKMVNDIHLNEINLIITVDNGISAFDAITRSNELGMDLIITDHHKIKKTNLDIFALIHPELAPSHSPYKFLAGVGVAYMIAINICNKLNYDIDKTTANALFCIGTIADMAPLIGANRKWLKECLPKINTTENLGIRKIIKKLDIYDSYISADDISFKIAPLINAVGRIGDPKLIIDLLTNSSESSITKLCNECFSINKERKRITSIIEKEALKVAYNEYSNNRKFLVLTNKEWHPGIIGIVAARIVENFNLPTAILSLGNDGMFRGSIRSNNHLKVNLALEECSDLLIAHGGHSAAAGFTIKEENIHRLKELLNNIAIRELKKIDISKSIKPDSYLHLSDISFDFYRQLILMGPFGIMNNAPIFWTRKCRIHNLYNLKGNHIKMKLDDGTALINAVKWNSSSQLKENDLIDIAYHVEINRWKKSNSLQLNIIDIKSHQEIIELQLHKRKYKCQLIEDMKILITNSKGQSISSDLSITSKKDNERKDPFSQKILSFAEIALGKTA